MSLESCFSYTNVYQNHWGDLLSHPRVSDSIGSLFLFSFFSEKKLDLPLIKGVDSQTEKTALVMDWILQMGLKADS